MAPSLNGEGADLSLLLDKPLNAATAFCITQQIHGLLQQRLVFFDNQITHYLGEEVSMKDEVFAGSGDCSRIFENRPYRVMPCNSRFQVLHMRFVCGPK